MRPFRDRRVTREAKLPARRTFRPNRRPRCRRDPGRTGRAREDRRERRGRHTSAEAAAAPWRSFESRCSFPARPASLVLVPYRSLTLRCATGPCRSRGLDLLELVVQELLRGLLNGANGLGIQPGAACQVV